MSPLPVSAVAATLPVAPTGSVAVPALGGAPAAGGASFADALGDRLDDVQRMQSSADSLAVQAATGRLQDVHDYTIAAAQAKLATEMTVALRNRAVEAFNEIMRLQG